MLVSHRKRFIYTKTLKTASTSVESYFEPYCMSEGEWSFTKGRPEHISEAGIIGCRTGDLLVIQGSTWWNHMPAATIMALVGERIWNDYYKFCVIRNPFDKLVSAYHGVRTRIRREDGVIEKGRFRAELLDTPENLKEDFEDWLKTDMLPPDRNKYLIDGEFCLDDVIRYEKLLEDIERVSNKLAIPFTPERLPQLKAGRRPERPLLDYYSDNSVEIVANAFSYELERFGYSPPL
jgi:hypothetical protein